MVTCTYYFIARERTKAPRLWKAEPIYYQFTSSVRKSYISRGRYGSTRSSGKSSEEISGAPRALVRAAEEGNTREKRRIKSGGAPKTRPASQPRARLARSSRLFFHVRIELGPPPHHRLIIQTTKLLTPIYTNFKHGCCCPKPRYLIHPVSFFYCRFNFVPCKLGYISCIITCLFFIVR